MNGWEYELAKEIKKNRMPPITGTCVGETVNVNPFQVKIQNGSIIIDKNNGHVCRQLLRRESGYTAENTHIQSGMLNGSGYTASGTMTQDGTIKLDVAWKAGDKVLVVPSGDGQHFFIVDILEV